MTVDEELNQGREANPDKVAEEGDGEHILRSRVQMGFVKEPKRVEISSRLRVCRKRGGSRRICRMR